MKQLRNGGGGERWDFLGGVLGGGKDPTDIDLAYERRGHFLFLEGKRDGQEIATGQRIFFDHLHAPPRFIVIRFEGVPPAEVHRFSRWDQPLRDGSTEDLCGVVCKWYDWANRQPFA